MICLDISGIPIAAARPKFVRMGKFVSTYDPQMKMKETWRWQIKTQYREEPLSVPVSIHVSFYLPIPKSTSKRKQEQMKTGEINHIVKPDIDNLLKFLLDCLNKIVLQDDSQIINLSAKKLYGSTPGTVVIIKTLNEVKMEACNASTS